MRNIGIVIAAFSMLCIIVTNIIYIMIMFKKRIHCKEVKDCKNRKCYVNKMCLKYNSQLTQEECDNLLKLIDESFKEERR